MAVIPVHERRTRQSVSPSCHQPFSPRAVPARRQKVAVSIAPDPPYANAIRSHNIFDLHETYLSRRIEYVSFYVH
jgi:hypothetical protein